MNFPRASTLSAAAGPLVLPVIVLATAVLAGMVTALVGTMAGERAIYYVAVFGLIVIGEREPVTRRDPVRFVFLALIVCFQLAAPLGPPGRLRPNVFARHSPTL